MTAPKASEAAEKYAGPPYPPGHPGEPFQIRSLNAFLAGARWAFEAAAQVAENGDGCEKAMERAIAEKYGNSYPPESENIAAAIRALATDAGDGK